jgi:hypothetical protein
MNNDLVGDSAVWRALFGVRSRPLLLLYLCIRCPFVKEPPKMLRRIMGPSLERGTVFDAVLSVNYRAIGIACL